MHSKTFRAFPDGARREVGYQLDRVQRGVDPEDWKPMVGVGAGVREIRVRDEGGAFRVAYVAKFKGAIFMLHCSQKKSQKTSREDIALTARRYADLARELG